MVNPDLTLVDLANYPELAKIVQAKLIQFGLLEPPADGIWGKYSNLGLSEANNLIGAGKTTAQLVDAVCDRGELRPLTLDNSLASRAIAWMKQRGYFISRLHGSFNIVYVEGMNPDGTPNADNPDYFNDLRLLRDASGETPVIKFWQTATSEPGLWYVIHPMNPGGAAFISHGQYKAWVVGTHGNSEPHEALVQIAPVTVTRDANKNSIRDGSDRQESGLFGINQHWGYDMQRVGKASAGCAVGQFRSEHRRFMELAKSDVRYQLSKGYVFYSTFIPGDKL